MSDFDTGAFDVFHVDAAGLSRADVDRVRIVQAAGGNGWSPACVAIRFDGEPVYCEDDLDVRIGDADGEVVEWTDPAGLHADCNTCADSSLLGGPMVAPAGWGRPTAENDFTTVVEVDCLEPGPRYSYRSQFDVPERADLVANVPVLATWDDHDFLGNNTDGRDEARDEASRAFTEYWGHELHGLPETPGIFAKSTWGDVDIFLLDGRDDRGVGGSMLGDAQLAWLQDGLVASTATFNLVIHGSQWTLHSSDDSWAACPDERDALVDFLAENDVQGVVLVPGDKHRSEFR